MEQLGYTNTWNNEGMNILSLVFGIIDVIIQPDIQEKSFSLGHLFPKSEIKRDKVILIW